MKATRLDTSRANCIVRHDHHRHAVGGERLHDVGDFAHHLIERRSDLVESGSGWPIAMRAMVTLLLAARKWPDTAPPFDRPHQLAMASARLLQRQVANLHRCCREIVEHGEMRKRL